MMIDQMIFRLAVVFCTFIFFDFLVSPPTVRAETKKDLYGDDLPLYAEARLGTVRFLPVLDIWAIAISPDGKTVASGSSPGSMDNRVELWNTGNGKKICTLFDNRNHANNIISMAWSPDSRKLAVSHNYLIEIWDVVERKKIGSLEKEKSDLKELYWVVKWSSDNKHIIGIKRNNNKLFIWDPSTRRLLKEMKFSRDLHDVALSDDGKRIVLSGQNLLKVFDASSGDEILDMADVEDNVTCVDISPNRQRIAGGCETKEKQYRIRFWNAETGKHLFNSDLTPEAVAQVAFDAQGKRLISKRGEHFDIWDISSKKIVKEIHSYCIGWMFSISKDRKTIRCMAFSLDNQHLATGAQDTTILVWDLSVACKNLKKNKDSE
jgi:WD40 repeat protein